MKGQETKAVPDASQVLEPLARGFSSFDWQEEFPNIDRALSNVWRQNGWTEEADLFARDVAREVSAIPPWQFADRMNVVTERVSQRYGFTPAQVARFRRTLLGTASSFLVRNAATLLSASTEAFTTRSHGRPFTAEQVAEWAQAAGPLMEDLRRSVDRFVMELEPALAPEQRRILQRDMASYEKRRRMLNDTMERWAEGKWRPEHWGLQDDRIHQAAATERESAAQRAAVGEAPMEVSGQAAALPPARWIAHEPSTWIAYVLEIEREYGLDAAQMTTAESVHQELLERAVAYESSRKAELVAVPPGQRSTHEAFQYIRDTFEELRERLDAVATTAQRAAAESRASGRSGGTRR